MIVKASELTIVFRVEDRASRVLFAYLIDLMLYRIRHGLSRKLLMPGPEGAEE